MAHSNDCRPVDLRMRLAKFRGEFACGLTNNFNTVHQSTSEHSVCQDILAGSPLKECRGFSGGIQDVLHSHVVIKLHIGVPRSPRPGP